MSEYTPTIGLEVHAQLKTKTKLFCNSKNDSNETRPNVNVCPICMGHPGTLPTLNKEAIRHVLKVGVAVGGTLADFTEWDRKNYFYPDIPKGYQISQYKYPLVRGGSIRDVELTRIHLEEDTGLNKHGEDYSLVDYNRAGIPLMELVTEPVIHGAEEAVSFAKELQLLLRYLGVAEANMEKGELRVEVNISVSRDGELGEKVEVKNLNSFRSVGRAIEYETKRQKALLEKAEKIVHETRGWDEKKQETFSQRGKEFAEDYRYFPEPDLPKLKLSEIPDFAEDVLRSELPELPWERRERYHTFGLKEEDAEVFVSDVGLASWFDQVALVLRDKELVKLASNYVVNDMLGLFDTVLVKGTTKYPGPKNFAKLIRMNFDGRIGSANTKEVLGYLVTINEAISEDPEEIAEQHDLLQKSEEGELKQVVGQVIKENPQPTEEYKKGKEEVLQFLVGQAMKATKGAANPQVLQKLFKELLQ